MERRSVDACAVGGAAPESSALLVAFFPGRPPPGVGGAAVDAHQGRGVGHPE